MTDSRRRELAREFMSAAFAQVEEKIELAIHAYEREQDGAGTGARRDQLGGLVVSGGVASNAYLRLR